MTQAMIDNKRLSRSVVRLNLQEINFVKLIESPSIKSLVEIAAQQDLSFSFEISDDIPDIMADPGLLLQALLNLIENAVNFTEKGSISVKIYKSGKNVRIDVTDSGIGIRKDEKSYLFKRFQQGSVKSNKAHIGSGVGLGLSIAKEIVNLHGGKLGFISEEGKGSTFWFILPHASRIAKERSA
jgi:Signal transduction histidine kinase